MANIPGLVPPPKGDIAQLARLARFLAPHSGRMIAPVGPADAPQELTLYQKSREGRVSKTVVMPVFFRALPGGVRL